MSGIIDTHNSYVLRTKATCPHCQHTNTLPVNSLRYVENRLVSCDVDTGGCDKEFVVKIEHTLSVQVFTLEAVK